MHVVARPALPGALIIRASQPMRGALILAVALALASCGGGSGSSRSSAKPSSPPAGSTGSTPPAAGGTPSTPPPTTPSGGQTAGSGSSPGTTTPPPTSGTITPAAPGGDNEGQPETPPAPPLPVPADIQIPSIPQIVVPETVNIGPAQRALETVLDGVIDPIMGISVKSATCNADGSLASDAGLTSIDAQGNPSRNGAQGIFAASAAGESVAHYGGAVITVDANGNGRIESEDAANDAGVINIGADGSGSYFGPYGMIDISQEYGAVWSGAGGNISVSPDGSGSWDGPLGSISVAADGSGTWSGGPYGYVVNNGDGTGLAGEPAKVVKMAPMAKLVALVRLPQARKFAPTGSACGFVVTFADYALFDRDQTALRANSTAALDALAGALKQTAAKDIEVRGHDDAASGDKLSTPRAQALLEGLRARGAADKAAAKGYGASQPLAPEEIKGQPSPGGRMLNRRVEVFVRI